MCNLFRFCIVYIMEHLFSQWRVIFCSFCIVYIMEHLFTVEGCLFVVWSEDDAGQWWRSVYSVPLPWPHRPRHDDAVCQYPGCCLYLRATLGVCVTENVSTIALVTNILILAHSISRVSLWFKANTITIVSWIRVLWIYEWFTWIRVTAKV